ncbi:hypothetical protein ACJ73_02754 [Blastomyces percursus]|uniref:Uncharacterized protein n=1 Tax=Blastomyces percursus TaxID=1658174 RepID=A0A1J9QBQ1_9EURO|nr:hypothetical protein ACJ73_02754 [Blastomyces percursus]
MAFICALDVIINRNPQKLTSIVDCLIMNVGRKYYMLGKRLQRFDIMLREISKLFRSQIRSSPFPVGHNRRVIQERGSGIAEAQAHVLEIKEQLVIPLEEDLRHLHEELQILPKTNSPFRLRFVLLFYRCRYAFLVDLLKTSECFNDPSCQCRILAEFIRRTVIIHSNRNTSNLNNSIIEYESKSLKTLEVEKRLLQREFYSLAKRAVKLFIVDEVAISRTKQRALVDLWQATLFVPAEVGCVERVWENPQCGKLVNCGNHHVYPAESFDDCPECGKDVVGGDELNYEQFLSETELFSLMPTQNDIEEDGIQLR